MIASNYRRFPQAMALQMPLPFGRALIWHTSRPTTRKGRAFRAAVSAAFKLAGRVAYPVRPTTPQWVRDAKRKARALAKLVAKAQRPLALDGHAKVNGFRAHVERCREQFDRYRFSVA